MKNHLSVLLLLLMISCSKGKDIKTDLQGLPEPIREQIIAAEKKCPECGIAISSFTYKERVIYGETCTEPNCNCFMVFYGEDGELLQYDRNTV